MESETETSVHPSDSPPLEVKSDPSTFRCGVVSLRETCGEHDARIREPHDLRGTLKANHGGDRARNQRKPGIGRREAEDVLQE